MVHMGRYTSALLLIATGVALVLDQTSDTQYLRMLLDWWPLILIVLGAEVIVLSLIYRHNGSKLQFSLGSVFGAAVIMLLVMLLTGFGDGKMNMNNWRFWEHAWKEVERPVERIVVDDHTKTIRIRNTNGKVIVRSGETDQIEVATVLRYSNLLGEDQSRAVEEESTLQITDGEILEIKAAGKRYQQFFWQTEARMDLTITVPIEHEFDYDLELSNGDVTAHDLQAADQVTIRTSNGDIEVRQVKAAVDITTRNGDIQISDMDSNVVLKTSNGDISISGISAAIDANTSNGDVDVFDISSSLSIHTSNGDVTLRSSTVGGNWKIDTRNGDIELYVPEQGDYRVRGIGDIDDVTIPWLTADKDSVEGQIGSGSHFIDAETNNGDIDIRTYAK